MENIKIFELLKNGSVDEIKNNLLEEILKISNYCDTIIGEGYFGKVKISKIGEFFNIKIDGNIKSLKVVVKESKNIGKFSMIDHNDDLIISSNNGIMAEAIILFMISKLWYDGFNIHLPFLLAMGSCDNTNPEAITRIILEKHGLDNFITMKYLDTIPNPNEINLYLENRYSQSMLITFYEFAAYLTSNMNMSDLTCELPNIKSVYVPDIIDYMCIFYLHTSYVLWKKLGIILGDQHSANMYVHWLNDNSMCGKKNISNIEYIYYEIGNNKYLKIPTNGIIFKIGDVGNSVMNIQNNVIVVGDLYHDIWDIFKGYKKYHRFYVKPIEHILDLFPRMIKNKTKINKLFDSNEYIGQYIPYMGFDMKIDSLLPTELDILNDNMYHKFVETKISDSENVFINHLE